MAARGQGLGVVANGTEARGHGIEPTADGTEARGHGDGAVVSDSDASDQPSEAPTRRHVSTSWRQLAKSWSQSAADEESDIELPIYLVVALGCFGLFVIGFGVDVLPDQFSRNHNRPFLTDPES